MELEQQLERIKGRQGDDKETIEMFKVGKIRIEIKDKLGLSCAKLSTA